MPDREFLKPAPITIESAPGQKRQYSFEDFLGDVAWAYPKWKEDDWADAQIRIDEIVEATFVGKTIGLSLEDWEKLREACKEQPIQGRWAGKLRKMARAVRSATKPGGDAKHVDAAAS